MFSATNNKKIKSSEEEASLADFDILEQDILNPNKPLNGIYEEEKFVKGKKAPVDQVVGLQLDAVISSKGIATQSVFKVSSIEDFKIPTDVKNMIELKPDVNKFQPPPPKNVGHSAEIEQPKQYSSSSTSLDNSNMSTYEANDREMSHPPVNPEKFKQYVSIRLPRGY